MINLALTVLCSSCIAIILKINSNRKGNSLLLITGNYLTASIIGFLLFLNDPSAVSTTDLIPFGVGLSFLFVGSFFAFSVSVKLSGAAISTVSSRVSVIIPTLLSILIYSETPKTLQIIGLILTIVTVILFYLSVANSEYKGNRVKSFFFLMLILLGIGFADFFMKVFQVNWESNYKQWFLFWIFFSSFILTSLLSILQRVSFFKKTFLLGMIMGIPNLFSSYFLIESLRTFPGVFVYPFVNISIILLTALIVKFFWKEYWNKFTILALVVGAVSALLLNL